VLFLPARGGQRVKLEIISPIQTILSLVPDPLSLHEIRIYVYTCIYAFMRYICVYVYTYIYIYTRYMRMHAYTGIYRLSTYVCTYVYTYTRDIDVYMRYTEYTHAHRAIYTYRWDKK